VTAQAPALPAIIPRAVLFGHPEKESPRISPDGTRISFLAPSDGLLAVWVQTVGGNDARCVASDPKRPIRNSFWSPDGSRVLFLQDAAGDENFHLFAVSPAGGDAVDLTPFEGVLAGVIAIEYDRPDAILVQLNRRDGRFFDVYRLNPQTGELTLDTENPGNVAGWLADRELCVRAAIAPKADGSADILVREAASAPWRVLASTQAEDGLPDLLAFTPDGGGLYAITSLGANAARLVRFGVADGSLRTVAADENYDAGTVFLSPRTHDLVAVEFERERSQWTVLDESYRADFEALRAADPGDLSLLGADRADRIWIAGYNRDDASPSFWIYDRAAKRATKLFDSRPALAGYTLSSMRPIAFAARDGLTIHGYLTLPPGVEPDGLPMVLFVHGGPWARDSWGFSAYPQWLANRGYAVLQVNFRSSTGYGKAFLNAGNREWAGAMHTDLLDAKAWAVEQGVADPRRVGIMGGSYGGYATLAGVTFSPDAFACGVDIVGPSNLNTLLASIPPYWETVRSIFTVRMGESEDFLTRQSPLFLADRIKVPLLIAQGANDPRVKIQESDQIVKAMRKNNLPVTYVVFEDEGHGFANPANNNRFNAATEAFFAEHLGGRAEPPSEGESISAFLR
jgi:dipeptidyl aminopeptidase/acylaminoacyl peptidase